MQKRYVLSMTVSVAVHAAFVGGVLFWMLRDLAGLRNVDIELTHVRLDDIRELPLGPPPGEPAPAAQRAKPKPPKAKPQQGGVVATREPEKKEEEPTADSDSTPDAGAPIRPSDLRGYAPEGSRLTVLMRLDRLRDTPYAQPVDELLMRMPDRRDLLEGTELDLYRDFDALLVATPDPLDYTVTLLVARHHLKDGPIREAIERGARATKRTLAWRTIAKRPVAERHRIEGSGDDRDQRLLVLPAPGLAVVTPPVYAKLLLEPPKPKASPVAASEPADGGADGSAAPAESTPAPPQPGWEELVRRIDAEDGAMPPDAAVMLTAVDLFTRRQRNGLVPPTRGAVDDGAQATGWEYIPIPAVLTVTLGPEPTPFLDARAEYKEERDAERLEKMWPALIDRVKHNVFLAMAGVSALMEKATLEREGSRLTLHVTAAPEDTVRLLQLAAKALPR